MAGLFDLIKDEAKAKVQAVINAQLQAKKLQNQTISAPSQAPIDVPRSGLASLETRFDPIQRLTQNIGNGYNAVRDPLVDTVSSTIQNLNPITKLLQRLKIQNPIGNEIQGAVSGALKKTFEDPIKTFSDNTLLARNKFQTGNKNLGDVGNVLAGSAANTAGLAMSAIPFIAQFNAGVGALQGNERTKGLGDAADFVGSLPSQGLGALASKLPVSDEVKQLLVMGGGLLLAKGGSKVGEGIGKRIDAGNLGRAASVVGKELTGKKATMFSGIDPTPFLKGVKEFSKNPIVQAIDPTGITTGLGATISDVTPKGYGVTSGDASKATPPVDPLINYGVDITKGNHIDMLNTPSEAIAKGTSEYIIDTSIKQYKNAISSGKLPNDKNTASKQFLKKLQEAKKIIVTNEKTRKEKLKAERIQDSTNDIISMAREANQAKNTGGEPKTARVWVKDPLIAEAKKYKSEKEFSDAISNRDFKYLGKEGKDIDQLKYLKTIAARNFIEEFYSRFVDNPSLAQKAVDDLGVVYSKDLNSYVKSPNLKDYFSENTQYGHSDKLEKVSLTDIYNQAKNTGGEPKTARVWVKSKFSDKGEYADIPVVRKEENITLYQGGKTGDGRQFWTPDRKYAEQFGDVREKTGDFYKIDNGNRVTNVYVEVPKKSGGEPPIPPVPPKTKTSMGGEDVPSRADVAAKLGDKIDSLMQKTAGYSTKDPVAPMKKGILGTLMSPVSKLNDMYTGALRKGQDALGTKLEQGLASDNPVARNAATALQGFFRGIAMSPERETKGMQFKGGLDVANKRAYDVTESLYQLANKDPKVLERVNAVLDPELAKTKVSFDDLTPTEKQLYGIIREGFDLVHDTSYANGNISPELYAQNKGKYTPRAYDTFELPDEITKALKQSGKKLDTGMYKERGEANTWKEEHALNDPVYSLGKRLAQVESNKVIKEYGDYIVSNPQFVSDVEKKGYTKLSDSPAYGELAGKYVLNNVAEDFKGFFFAREGLNSWYDGLKAFDSNPIRQGQKKSQTIYNPLTHLGNATSNIVFSFMAKVNPLSFAKEIASVTKDTARRKQLGDYLTKQGILGTSVARSEFTNQLAEIRQLGSGEKKTVLQKILGVGKKIDDTVTGIYGGTDDLSKIAAFSALLKKGKSLEEATRLVSDGFQNYNKVGKFYDVYAKTPLIGSAYVKFKGDFLRMLKNAAVNSPLELAGFLMAMKAGADAVSSMSGESPEDKKTREERLGSPHIPLPNGDHIPLTWQTPFGEINVARYVSPMYNYQGTDEDKKNAFGQYASYLPFGNLLDIAANYKKDPAGAAAGAFSDPTFGPLGQALFLDRDFRGKQISDPTANKYQPTTLTPKEQQANVLKFLQRAYTPPTLNNAEDLVSNLSGNKDYYGKTRSPLQAIAKALGIKVEQFGPEQVQEIRDKTTKYEEAKQNTIEKNITDIVKKVLSGERTEAQGEEQIKQYNDASFDVMKFAEDAKNKLLLKKDPIPKTAKQIEYTQKKAEMSTKKNQILLQRMQELAREGTAEEALTALRAKYPRLSEEAIAKIVKDTREGKTY